MTVRIKQKLTNFTNALLQLENALNEPLDKKRLALDATIQRFEFSYELFWKILKVLLEQEGIEANTPRQVFQEAYRARWLDNEQLWLEMMKDRNTTTHVYNEKIALEIYQHIKTYFPFMKKICIEINNKFKE
ncbi:MAG TPA: HI0074 family nucleotidyltransferase substrate-binding subunit [Gammaproteobacteria bacterium]|nr:HI0074 family nucleotidyltransferase substrate-binding subunit [Gammaproteobacteria bacterium]